MATGSGWTPAVGWQGASDAEVEEEEEAERAESTYSGSGAEEGQVKVVVRVRPPLPRELTGYRPYENAALVDPSHKVITLSENLQSLSSNGVVDGLVYNTYRYAFDHVYGPDSRQEEVYQQSARSAVLNVLDGYNATIIAYGQTGTGKTYTMEGEHMGPSRGIIPRAIEDVFGFIQRDTGERCKFLVRASYLQIYNEVISDLLKPENQNLVVREDRRRGVHVEGLSEWVVRNPSEVYALMEKGAAARATGATKLNEISSRSHAIFMLIVEKSVMVGGVGVGAGSGGGADGMEQFQGMAPGMGKAPGGVSGSVEVQQSVRVGKLNLVDLAGSERVHVTGATGKRLEESKKINQSLSALGNVIAALTDPKGKDGRPHIPYRDSKLTRILEDSLGGNCKTTFMAMISPAVEAFAESLSTLKFANRAKNIRNLPKVNEDLDHRTLLRKYERELRKLRAELQQKSKDLVDKRLVLQIEEARRREQADKIAAINALERQSKEIMRHKQVMAQLQSRITSMQSQLLIGGQKVEDLPQFRTLLAKEQARIRQQYEDRLREIEKERQSVEEDRAQVERYKQLLLKQRDIMIALTQRLTERDEQILSLQAEIGAYDTQQRKLEDLVDQKTAELIALRKSVAEHGDDAAAALDGEPGMPAGASRGPEQVSPGGYESDSTALGLEGHQGGSIPGNASGSSSQSGAHTRQTSEDWPPGVEPTPSADNLQQQLQELSLRYADKAQQHSTMSVQLAEAERREAALQQAVEALQDQLDEAQAAAAAPTQDTGGGSGSRLASLAQQCKGLSKERDALRTILDAKVRVLVEEIGKSVGELPHEAQAHPKLQKQLDYLGKLVKATVNAMAAPVSGIH
ncbi:hypothetical protein N2152v2_010461 [Parachlorella kessleri]